MSDGSQTLGQRLRAERERKGLSCQKAADELHLDGWVIEGLESGDYSRIGPSVYAKGHLKRYAELLGLPVAEILAGFGGQPLEEAPAPASVGMRMRTSPTAGSELPWLPIAGMTLAAVLIAGVWWWHPWHPRVVSVPAAVPAAAESGAATGPEASPPPPEPANANGSAATAGAAPHGAAAPIAAAGSAPPATAAPAEPVPPSATGRVRLRLLFVADSWVDIHDAAGQRVFAGNGRANNVRSLSGMGPLRVYIKTASNVHLDINNHTVAIGPQFILDNAAHFLAGADGVLRRDPQVVPSSGPPAAARPRG
jgi:cytoskeleton protein RodZ